MVDDYAVLGPTPALDELRRWAKRVIADATPDKDGAVGFVSDTELTAARRFFYLDHHMMTGNIPADWRQ